MILFFRIAAFAASLLLVACGPKPVDILIPLAPSVRSGATIAEIIVTLSPLAAGRMARLDAKAEGRRAAAGLASAAPGAAPTPEQYAGLPFTQMFEAMLRDTARKAGLAGRPVKVAVDFDRIGTADAGKTLLVGGKDRLAGLVKLIDPASGEELGQFYVDVVNSHQGLIGLALRGGGIREKLAGEFAGHVVKQLRGRP